MGQGNATLANTVILAHVPAVTVFREEFLPVSQTFVRDHVAGLRRWTPTVVCVRRVGGDPDLPGVEVRVAERRRFRGLLDRQWAKATRRSGQELTERRIRSEVKTARGDLVHAHFGPDAALVAAAVGRDRKPVVATFHGYDASVRPAVLAERGPNCRRLVEGGGELLRSFAAIIAVSQDLSTRLVDRGADPARVQVIPCGVDTDRFEYSDAPVDGTVLFVGRLVDKKGCHDLLDAVAGLNPRPRLVVIGDGPRKAALQNHAERLRLKVDWRGAQRPEHVRAAMSTAALVAMPSQTGPDGDTEGMPVVSVEAGASGRPVVGYLHGGLKDSVVDGETGFLVDERNTAALRDRIAQLLGDPTMRIDFGRRGRDHIERHFRSTDLLARVEAVYDGVAERGAVAAPLGS